VEVSDVAFGDRDDVHAGECQSFEKTGGVFLITAESVQRFRQDDVETSVQSIVHQRLEARAEKRRTRDSVIRVLVRERPTLTLRKCAADPELIRDRCITLIVGRVPRVDADLHHFTSVHNRRLAAELRLEHFARRLPRQHPHKCPERIAASRINRFGRSSSNDWRITSGSPSVLASSFGHDTPAHVDRRSWFWGVRDIDEWAALECGSERAVVGIERGRCIRRSERASCQAARSNQSV
jgi:hypothetical protein